ncbi:amidohydrolase family protein [Mycobacterium sp. NPDC003449]
MRSFRLIAVLVLMMAGSACAPGGGDEPSSDASSTDAAPGKSPAAPSAPARGGDEPATEFRDVRIFDGHTDRLSAPSRVRVRGNRIERISTEPLPAEDGVTVIDGAGRTLMPGLIDNHWHTMFVRPPATQLLNLDVGYLNLLGGDEARDTLMRGFTTVRDLGGPSFGLKKAIDEGVTEGPRIFPSGAMISVTSGHGDFRSSADLPRSPGGPPSRQEEMGGSMIADSPDEVRLRAREQLFQGASQIKLTAGGGVSSPHSPLDVVTFTEPEVRAATEAAGNWGTYVAVHAYTPVAIQQAIRAGVKCIEHAHLMDEATAKEMADKDIWLSTQPIPAEMVGAFPPGSGEAAKAKDIVDGVDNVYKLARKYHLKTAFGTDILFSPALAPKQGALLAGLGKWFSPAETLEMATGTNAQLLAMSGKRSPYQGKLGVVEEGALADLLLVDGDPLADLNLVADPERNFTVIMKDGKVYKNTLT